MIQAVINNFQRLFYALWVCVLVSFSVSVKASLSDGLDATFGTIDRLGPQTGIEKMIDDTRFQDDLDIDDMGDEKNFDEADKELPDVSFKLKNIIIERSTVIKVPELKQFWAEFINKEVTFSELKKVTDKITNYYRQQGYFLSYATIPVQEVNRGQVKILIIEGYIDRTEVIFEDKSMKPNQKLVTMVEKIKKDRPLSQSTFERYISLIRDLYPYAKGYLQPSQFNGDGAAELQVVIPKQAYFDGQISTNNFGKDTVGPWMFGANFEMPSPWMREDKIQVRYNQGTYASELYSAGLGYTVSLGSEGTVLGLDALLSRSQPTGKIKVFDAITHEDRGSLTLMHPLIRSREANLYAGLEFTSRNQTRRIRFIDSTKKERSRDLKLVTIATLQDDIGGRNAMRLSFTQGLRMMNSVDLSYINRTRPRGSADHSFVEFNISRLQQIKGPFAIGFYIDGQYANATLLDINRYRSNGYPYNGAYPIGTLSGDSGVEGKVEFNYYNYDIPQIKMLRLFAYLSKVKVWNRHPQLAEFSSESAKGAGAGIQAVTEFGLSSTLQYGYPFDNPVGGERIKPMVGFNMNYKF